MDNPGRSMEIFKRFYGILRYFMTILDILWKSLIFYENSRYFTGILDIL